MVLVDTSVWIRFLAGREPFASELDELLERDEVLAHDLVEGELVVGNGDGRRKLLAAYDLLVRAPTVQHAEVMELVGARRLGGRGLGWIDVHLLASALVVGASLWTADARLAAAALDLRVNR